jgi:hypothetical protein
MLLRPEDRLAMRMRLRGDDGVALLARKPRMLANKMARIVWALLVKQENYKAPVAAKA